MSITIKALPSLDYLNTCFLYEEETGKLYWNHRPESHFPNERTYKMWNNRFAGRECNYRNRNYYTIMLNGDNYRVHRIIFKIFYGREPFFMLDHIDGNSLNNKIDNLRECTASQNQHNRRAKKNVQYKGVSFDARSNCYYARCNGQHIGTFRTAESAHAAYCAEASARYGAFARFQ
jgi:hypothetical protein